MLDSVASIQKQFQESGKFTLRPINDDCLADLQFKLNKSASKDAYAKSAAYFALTGRNGLWIAQNEETTIILCRHPNIENEFLVFPPYGEKNSKFTLQVLNAVRLTGATVKLARFAEEDKIFLNGNEPTRTEETVLDWAFDVHTIDTKAVSEHRGKVFQHIRTDLNKLSNESIRAFDLDFKSHREAVLKVAHLWSEEDPKVVEVYERLLNLDSKLPISGRIIFKDDLPVAFSIWEETNPEHGVANTYAMLANSSITGLSRYLIVDMCSVLQKRGFNSTCLGGSESEGLDQFKKLLRPINSLSLNSFVPKPENILEATPQNDSKAEISHRRFG